MGSAGATGEAAGGAGLDVRRIGLGVDPRSGGNPGLGVVSKADAISQIWTLEKARKT